MKIISIIIILCSSFFLLPTEKKVKTTLDTCEFEGKKLYGKIKLVENQYDADVKVKIVNSFPDLRVKFVENFADDCGEWQIVENGEDLKVYITENFPDIKIKPVASFPGLEN